MLLKIHNFSIRTLSRRRICSVISGLMPRRDGWPCVNNNCTAEMSSCIIHFSHIVYPFSSVCSGSAPRGRTLFTVWHMFLIAQESGVSSIQKKSFCVFTSSEFLDSHSLNFTGSSSRINWKMCEIRAIFVNIRQEVLGDGGRFDKWLVVCHRFRFLNDVNIIRPPSAGGKVSSSKLGRLKGGGKGE